MSRFTDLFQEPAPAPEPTPEPVKEVVDEKEVLVSKVSKSKKKKGFTMD
jgi:hypothetical protein